MVQNLKDLRNTRFCRFDFAAQSGTGRRMRRVRAPKAADLNRGRPPLAPIEVPVYIASEWETRQR
jgi:hypothetical protein